MATWKGSENMSTILEKGLGIIVRSQLFNDQQLSQLHMPAWTGLPDFWASDMMPIFEMYAGPVGASHARAAGCPFRT